MSEFKVGDKVRIISERWDHYGSEWPPGSEGILVPKRANSSLYPFRIERPGGTYSLPILEEEIELVESAPVEEDYAVEVEADEFTVAAVLRLMGVDVSDEEMETAVDLAIMLGSARVAKEADNG